MLCAQQQKIHSTENDCNASCMCVACIVYLHFVLNVLLKEFSNKNRFTEHRLFKNPPICWIPFFSSLSSSSSFSPPFFCLCLSRCRAHWTNSNTFHYRNINSMLFVFVYCNAHSLPNARLYVRQSSGCALSSEQTFKHSMHLIMSPKCVHPALKRCNNDPHH